MDLAAIISLATTIVDAVVKAAPVIEQDIATAAPYVNAIVELAKNGGGPSDAMFKAVNDNLDAGSLVISKRALEAQATIDAGQGD